ncbi:hypothetical protein JCM10450v2_007006 [Rhodotorula kratochvilovae]
MSATNDYPTVATTQYAATVIMGPNQAGYLAQIMLFGVFIQMLFMYWRSGELATHARPARIALGASLLLNTVYTAICFQQAYVGAVGQDRTYDALANGDAIWNALPILNGLISVVAERYLAARAGALISSRRVRYVFWGWVGILIAVVLLGASVTTADGVLESDLLISYNAGSAIWMFGTAFADLSISLACAWALRSRIRGFNPETDTLLRKLTLIFVRTAAYTTVLSFIAAIILVATSDDDLLSFLNMAFWTPGAALSGLSLFTFSASSRRVINARLGHSGSGSPEEGISGSVYIRRPALGTGAGKVRSSAGPGIALQHLSSGVAAAQAPLPLQISVQHQSVVEYEGPEEEGLSVKGDGLDKEARDFAV